MLDRHSRLNYPEVSLDYPEELFRATYAEAETDAGDHIDVCFRAVPPPGASRFYVNWRPRQDHKDGPSSSWAEVVNREEYNWDQSLGLEPLVVAATATPSF